MTIVATRMHSGLQEHSLSFLSDGMLVLMPENAVPIQDVLGDIEWVDSWLKEMGLSPTALSTYHVLISVLYLHFYR